MSAPTVFVSYSHRDKDLLTPLIAQLKTLEQSGLLEVWADTRIDAGDKWYPEIEDAMKRAAVAVCLVSEYFLSSDFCTKQEVPFLLKRAADDGVLIVPVLLSECVWEAHRWLKETQMLPGEGQSIRTHFAQNPAAVFSRAAKRIFDKLNDPAYAPPSPPPEWRALAPEFIDLTRLPETGSALFGRDGDLKLLDESWQSVIGPAAESTRVLVFTAHGGVGKSTLVNHWLAEMARENYRGATRVFGWSFFSQGVREENVASADSFIDAALRFFGDTEPSAGSPWDKGGRLAGLVGGQRALLVLDGMEPLQSPYEFERGKLRDPALESLLRGLARHSAGLCLISTREPVPDLAGRSGVVTRDLEQIGVEAGRALLRTARVVGTDAELEALANRFGPHALSVTLLGVYLYQQPGHGIGPAKELEQLPGEKPIDKVLAGFENWLGHSPEREALRLLGFFDRPANEGCLCALRQAPPVEGLTHHLSNLSDTEWNRVLDRVGNSRLIHLTKSQSGKQFVDAHPLIREYFAQQLKGSEAWREGHRRLYEYLCENTKEGDEPTLEDLQPLYQAVAHGCQAALYEDACANVYSSRILRREQHYSWRKLGCYGAEVGALAWFFEEPWVRIVTSLSEPAQGWLLNQTAFCLQALGRLSDAVQPMRVGAEKADNVINAAIGFANLSELQLAMGEVSMALADGKKVIELTDRKNEWGVQILYRSAYADALHQAGCLRDAEVHFRWLEEEQRKNDQHQFLYGITGFQYCDLLLNGCERAAWNRSIDLQDGKGELHAKLLSRCLKVHQRASATLQLLVRHEESSMLDHGLNHLTLGRAALYEAVLSDSSLATCHSSLADAVSGLRRSGDQTHLPHGLLTRAWLRFFEGKHTGPESAQEDLDEAWEIAERGPMRLHMADIHLYRARLFHKVQPYPWNKFDDGREGRGPKDDLDAAEELINKCGYHRRDEELADAKLAILGTT
jgi:TIR domain